MRRVAGRRRASLTASAHHERLELEGLAYLDAAQTYLEPAPPLLVAVGGFSGTGKSTLSASLAPRLGSAPGAIHLRSDLERKALHGADELTRLPSSAYTPGESARVYEVLASKARTTIAARHAVVVDAVFSTPEERAAIEAVARERDVAFCGLWLTADPAHLSARISARTGDASDANEAVLKVQLERGAGNVGWHAIDAGGAPAATLMRAEDALVRFLK